MMKQNIKFDDIINFIYKAIELNYYIEIRPFSHITISHRVEYTSKTGNKYLYNCFEFKAINSTDDELIIAVDNYYADDMTYTIVVKDPRDIARWKILIEDVKEYMFKSIEDKLNNFFKED